MWKRSSKLPRRQAIRENGRCLGAANPSDRHSKAPPRDFVADTAVVERPQVRENRGPKRHNRCCRRAAKAPVGQRRQQHALELRSQDTACSPQRQPLQMRLAGLNVGDQRPIELRRSQVVQYERPEAALFVGVRPKERKEALTCQQYPFHPAVTHQPRVRATLNRAVRVVEVGPQVLGSVRPVDRSP